MRKTYNAIFKSKVAMEAIKSDKRISELSSKYEVHRDQVQKWKKVAVNSIKASFSGKGVKERKNNEKLANELYMEIGRLKIENDWLKKRL